MRRLGMRKRGAWIAGLLIVVVSLPLAGAAQRGGRRMLDRAFGHWLLLLIRS